MAEIEQKAAAPVWPSGAQGLVEREGPPFTYEELWAPAERLAGALLLAVLRAGGVAVLLNTVILPRFDAETLVRLLADRPITFVRNAPPSARSPSGPSAPAGPAASALLSAAAGRSQRRWSSGSAG